MRSFIRSYWSFFVFSWFLSACKTTPNADKQFTNPQVTELYKIKLNPVSGSYYKYNIKNETELKLEVDDKKIDNINHTSYTVNYQINKDSTGNINLNIRYDKIHIYTKNGDEETDVDADNAANTINSLEKMLGILKGAPLKATLDKSGQVKSVSGYKELGAKMMAGMAANDSYSGNLAQAQWNKVVEDGLVKKNINELFSFFPDSAVHIGDQWKISTKQKTELPLNVETTYRLKNIKDGIASLEENAAITGEPGSFNYQGTDVTMDLNGEEEGEFSIDIKTGLLVDADKHSKIKGSLQMVGREIPVYIDTHAAIHMLKP